MEVYVPDYCKSRSPVFQIKCLQTVRELEKDGLISRKVFGGSSK
jgi:hypothetical protein